MITETSGAETHATTPNRFAQVGDHRYAYRRFGNRHGSPIIFRQHYRGNMDYWDPIVTDELAREHEVILFDNAGVGLSSGQTPDNVLAMTNHVSAFVDSLGLAQFDILGFSLGGFIAQRLALTRPSSVRRIILAATGPQGGQGMDRFTTDVATHANPDIPDIEDLLAVFFEPTERSQTAGRAHYLRTSLRVAEPDTFTNLQTRDAQLKAIQAWGAPDGMAYARLKYIQQPVLVVNGINDTMFLSINSFILASNIPNAILTLYPDSGHGSIFQYAELFAKQALGFLAN
jgi:pimeloyl-ACP methyl ester carboxylesterase